MPRLIRRRPLAERIKSYLNPADFLLWLSEEVDSSDWDQWQKDWATPIGVGLNLIFLIARANSANSARGADDVFGDDEGYSWWSWLAVFIVHLLSILSFLNAAYTFYRRRHYRLFETPVDAVPRTPSAHRVRVNSSPISSSPLRFLSKMLAADTAESRAHPDATRDVWELAVWDPTPLSLRMFCLFSPGHVLVYWLFLPTTIADPRPSTAVVTTILLAALLSAQLLVLQTSFSQQSKDTSLIHKEVLNEYDTKFVHPRTQPLTRDVGIQYSSSSTSTRDSPSGANSVETYTPTVVINRGFRTQPNPNYVKHVDPEGHNERFTPSRGVSMNMAPLYTTPAHLRDASSPIRPRTAIRQQPLPRASVAPETGGDGGSLGVYSHVNSPLRKAASTNFREHRATSPVKREGSPLKRVSMPGLPNGQRMGRTGLYGEREPRIY